MAKRITTYKEEGDKTYIPVALLKFGKLKHLEDLLNNGTLYVSSGTSSAGCVSSSAATSSVTVVSTPTANAGASQTITCTNPTVSLSGSGVSTYSWSGPGIVSGSNTANPMVNASGNYFLIGSTGGCTSSNTASVTVFMNIAAPSVAAASNSSLICGPPFQGTATLTATGSAATYSWMPSGSGASISVSPSVTTTYTVIATGSNGCTNMATITQNVSTCTGIKTFEEALGLVVYPNPTNGKIAITYKMNWLGFEIYNSLGEKLQLNKVVGKESVEVDLSSLPDGIYFVKVGSVTRKIIKQ